ncbi:MAG: type II secretion system protein N [Gammaproteobacteria bacterium]|nr:type II secretion system protein N [Gammaproteobacteria bacterium]
MKKQWRRYALLGGIAFAVFLMIDIPAALVYSLTKSWWTNPAKPIKAFNIDGTVWSGQAGPLELPNQTIQNVSWKLHPWSILLGRMETDISLSNNQSRAKALVGKTFTGQLYVNQAEARVPANELLTALKLPAFPVSGEFRANIKKLAIANQTLERAEGTLTWFGAGVQFPQRLSFGDVSARFETTDDGIKAIIADGGGVLELNGQLIIKANGQYQFNGVMAARDGIDSPLANSLKFLGQPTPEGKVNVVYSGKTQDLAFFAGN